MCNRRACNASGRPHLRNCFSMGHLLSVPAALLFCSAASAQPLEWAPRATQNHPSARWLHAMAYDSARGVTVLMGGSGSGGGGAQNDTWEYDGTNWSLRSTSGPPFRADHAMVYDSQRGVCVLFGGYPDDNATWEWNGTSWSAVTRNPSPVQRWGCGMAYDSARGKTVLFGGEDVNRVLLGDTWEYDGTNWTQQQVSGPPPLYQLRMAYDVARARTVLYGGSLNGGANSVSGNTWEWDGTSWTLRSTTGPHGRYRHALAYDSDRHVCVMYGGTAVEGGLSRQTWEWNGASWTQRSINNPGDRYGHAMAYDPARHVTMVFGDVSNRTDTWELRVPCASQISITTSPHSAAACAGTAVPFAVVANGPFPIAYSWEISVGPNQWMTLTESPVALPCGGTASASPADGAAADITVSPCVGVYQYQVRAMMRTATCMTASAPAFLQHFRSADIDGNGVVNSVDFFEYVCEFLGGCPATPFTDFNQSGAVTSQDLFDYIAAFFAVC